MHDLVIRDACVLRQGTWQTQDIGVDAGQFTTFAPGQGGRTLDAAGRKLLPGGVDLHVHFNEPGRTHWEGFASGSLSAVAGGNTFFVEMPLNSVPSTVCADTLQKKLAAVGEKSFTDFGLWGGLVPGNAREIAGLHRAGVAGFKAFMSPSGTDDFQNSDTATLREGMREIAKTGKVLALHAEDPAVLEAASRQLPSKRTAFDWERSRPAESEISAVRIAIDLAAETGCRIHIVHVSAPPVLELIQKAKGSGLPITCETCPHYLLLSIEEADLIGPDAKCAPPLRSGETVKSMWTYLKNGCIDTIGSDHSPCPPDMKAGKTFYDAWGGVSGLQHGLSLLWQKSVDDLDLFQRLLAASCHQPGKLINLDKKGQIEVGYDADFVLVENLQTPETILLEDLHYRHAQTAYRGQKLSLKVSETWLRGDCLYKSGQAQGAARGKFVGF